jgi:hypothetical protein
MPVVPGINGDEENIYDTALFLDACVLKYLNSVPYKQLGITPYEQVGMRYTPDHITPPTRKDLNIISDFFKEQGITVFRWVAKVASFFD